RSQTRSWRARKVGQSTRVAGAVCSAISVSKCVGSTASDRVVRRKFLPAPCFAGRPVCGRGGPELVRRGQPQREQNGGTEVETARRDVTLADMRLVPAESDREPTAGVERSRRLDHAAHHGRQRATDLRRTYTVRQLVPQRHLGEELERAEPIGEGAADGREGTLGRDQALLNGGVAARPRQDRRA